MSPGDPQGLMVIGDVQPQSTNRTDRFLSGTLTAPNGVGTKNPYFLFPVLSGVKRAE